MKRLLKVLVCFLLVVGFVPTKVEAKTSYSAYKKVIQKLEKEYGKMSVIQNYTYSGGTTVTKLGGVAYINMFDMNGDGSDELIVYYDNGGTEAHSDYTYEIYTMKGKKAVLAGTGTDQIGVQIIEDYTMVSTVEGITYFVTLVDYRDLTYYTIEDYKLTQVISYQANGVSLNHFVNGEEVSDEEFNEVIEKWSTNAETTDYYFTTSSSYNSLDSTVESTNSTRKKLGLKTIDLDDELNEGAWKTAYSDFVTSHSEFEFCLVDLNGDSIPELYGDSAITATGSIIATYSDGSVNSKVIGVSGLMVVDGNEYFHEIGGRQGYYYDTIYQLKDGEFIQVAKGEYEQETLDSETTYMWEGSSVSESEYKANINKYIDTSKEESAYKNCTDADTVKAQIKNY